MKLCRVSQLSALILTMWFNLAYGKANLNNLDTSGFILKGYDPVSYFQSTQPQKGLPQFKTTYQGATYLFSSNSNKMKFLKNPNKYIPLFGGWCAYAVADSKSKVDIDPKSFLIQDGKLLVFYNGLWADTRKKWLKDPNSFLKNAEQNWPAVQNKEP